MRFDPQIRLSQIVYWRGRTCALKMATMLPVRAGGTFLRVGKAPRGQSASGLATRCTGAATGRQRDAPGGAEERPKAVHEVLNLY